jgi:hypothetical protein
MRPLQRAHLWSKKARLCRGRLSSAFSVYGLGFSNSAMCSESQRPYSAPCHGSRVVPRDAQYKTHHGEVLDRLLLQCRVDEDDIKDMLPSAAAAELVCCSELQRLYPALRRALRCDSLVGGLDGWGVTRRFQRYLWQQRMVRRGPLPHHDPTPQLKSAARFPLRAVVPSCPYPRHRLPDPQRPRR